MHSFSIALAFCSMIILPCLVTLKSGGDSE